MRTIWCRAFSPFIVGESLPWALPKAGMEAGLRPSIAASAFKQLRKSDISPIRYKKVAEADDKEVPAEEIVKGYEYEKGKWVTLEDKDFEALEIASTHAIEISDFVDGKEIDTKYFHKPYFLEAQKGGEKGYALLHRALRETGKIGIAKVAIRSREYLAAVKPDGLFLMLELMHSGGTRRSVARWHVPQPSRSPTRKSKWRKCWSKPCPASGTRPNTKIAIRPRCAS